MIITLFDTFHQIHFTSDQNVPNVSFLQDTYVCLSVTCHLLTQNKKVIESLYFTASLSLILVNGVVIWRSKSQRQNSHTTWKVLDFFLENSRIWKVLEKYH